MKMMNYSRLPLRLNLFGQDINVSYHFQTILQLVKVCSFEGEQLIEVQFAVIWSHDNLECSNSWWMRRRCSKMTEFHSQNRTWESALKMLKTDNLATGANFN